jgi:uncharacterized protein
MRKVDCGFIVDIRNHKSEIRNNLSLWFFQMNKKLSFPFQKKYLSLRDEADTLCLNLEKKHRKDIRCARGCCSCCMDFCIFPVEFYSILKGTEGRDIRTNNEPSQGACPFLIEGLCLIYESRPLICRTHGLPLLYMGEDEWQMSWCELNFTGKDIPEFGESNTFPQDRFNSKLYMINKEFVNSLEGKPYSDTDLLTLRDLSELISPP